MFKWDFLGKALSAFFEVVNKTKISGVCFTRKYYFCLKMSCLIQCVDCCVLVKLPFKAFYTADCFKAAAQ